MLTFLGLSFLVLIHVDFLSFLASSVKHFRYLLCFVNQSAYCVAGRSLVIYLFNNIAENWSQILIPLFKYFPHLFSLYLSSGPQYVTQTPCCDNHRESQNNVYLEGSYKNILSDLLIVQKRKLRANRFGDFLKGTQMIRRGPWIWAFQFQDQCISIYPLIPQVLLSAYHMLGQWFQVFSFPMHLRNSTHTLVTKAHSSLGEKGKNNENLDKVEDGESVTKQRRMSSFSSPFTPTPVPCWDKPALYQTASCGPSASILSSSIWHYTLLLL